MKILTLAFILLVLSACSSEPILPTVCLECETAELFIGANGEPTDTVYTTRQTCLPGAKPIEYHRTERRNGVRVEVFTRCQ